MPLIYRCLWRAHHVDPVQHAFVLCKLHRSDNTFAVRAIFALQNIVSLAVRYENSLLHNSLRNTYVVRQGFRSFFEPASIAQFTCTRMSFCLAYHVLSETAYNSTFPVLKTSTTWSIKLKYFNAKIIKPSVSH